MKTSIKENIKRNITIGGIALIFITLIGWIWDAAGFQKTVYMHMENVDKTNAKQNTEIKELKDKVNSKSIYFVPRGEFDQVIKRIDERNEMIIKLLEDIKKDVRNNNKK